MTATGYGAFSESAAIVGRSDRLRMLFGGPNAAETLGGLLSNDVMSLSPGAGQYAAALDPKGKIIADVRVFMRSDDCLVDTSAAAAPGFQAMIRKFVNPRRTKYVDASDVLRTVGLFGPRARTLLASVLGHSDPALSVLAPFQHLRFRFEGTEVVVARVPDFGVDGFDVFVPVEVETILEERFEREGAVRVDAEAAEIARVEAGRPRWGVDMDERTLAQEANLDDLHGISYTKGCFTGQETVARIHFRGHVNRSLRGLLCAAQFPSGALLFGAEGQEVGDVRSSVTSPRLGPIALAMLRREVQNGAEVTARWEGGEAIARAVALPFEATNR